MNTPEQKLKFVMEAVGECVHKYPTIIKSAILKDSPTEDECIKATMDLNTCEKCGAYSLYRDANPSPDDIGKLMGLARNLGYNSVLLDAGMAEGQTLCQIIKFKEPDCDSFEQVEVFAMSDAEALLNALFVAKGGKDN